MGDDKLGDKSKTLGEEIGNEIQQMRCDVSMAIDLAISVLPKEFALVHIPYYNAPRICKLRGRDLVS